MIGEVPIAALRSAADVVGERTDRLKDRKLA